MAKPAFVEDELGKRWDRCLVDIVLKVGGGFAVGGVASLIMFKRKKWPILMGTGFGVGLAYGNCERSLSAALSIPDAST